ncbi:MAG TPA: hypothetical protein VND19_10540 [Acetobacteraceae bacterium]|nr:hypothetical protein [Acetobacteraceae bacterium]
MGETATHSALAKVIHMVDDWRGDSPFELVIGWGTERGMKVGDRFLVFGCGPRLSDPDTGEDLGLLEVVRGHGIVTHVQDRVATLRSTERRRRSGATRRIVREGGGGVFLAGLGLGRVIEEEVPDDEDKPFANVQINDLAKPI